MGRIQRTRRNLWMDKGSLTLPCFNSIWCVLNLNSIFFLKEKNLKALSEKRKQFLREANQTSQLQGFP